MTKFRTVLVTMSPLDVLDDYLNSTNFQSELDGVYGRYQIVGVMCLGINEHGLIQYQFVLQHL